MNPNTCGVWILAHMEVSFYGKALRNGGANWVLKRFLDVDKDQMNVLQDAVESNTAITSNLNQIVTSQNKDILELENDTKKIS